MDSSMTDNDFIEDWLLETFGDGNVPSFERNEGIMEFLSSIMLKNKEAEKDCKEIIKADQHLISFYDKKSTAMKSIIKEEVSQLNPDVLNKVQKVCSLANRMNLKEPSVTNFLLAINDATNKEFENQIEEKEKNYLLSSLCHKITVKTEENDKMKRNLKILKEKSNARQSENEIKAKMNFLLKKKKEYSNKKRKADKLFKAAEYQDDLSHRSIVEKDKEFKRISEECKQISAKLNSYEKLSPNEALTKFKVQEMQQKLEVLNNEFEKLLESP